mmetsp:Transcript_4698/g.14027  ORF Transcript_4698/g.14027 Transcript_4698/m.14027 type:complete len:230 (-) Transcript_4698:2173-2862(-)
MRRGGREALPDLYIYASAIAVEEVCGSRRGAGRSRGRGDLGQPEEAACRLLRVSAGRNAPVRRHAQGRRPRGPLPNLHEVNTHIYLCTKCLHTNHQRGRKQAAAGRHWVVVVLARLKRSAAPRKGFFFSESFLLLLATEGGWREPKTSCGTAFCLISKASRTSSFSSFSFSSSSSSMSMSSGFPSSSAAAGFSCAPPPWFMVSALTKPGRLGFSPAAAGAADDDAAPWP